MFDTLILTHFLLAKGGKALLRAWVSSLTTKATLLHSRTRRPNKCLPLPFWQLAPSHMKRDYNQWADELTHPGFAEFRPERQLHVSEAFSQFNIFWSLLEETNLQDRFPKDVRPTQRPPKVPWSLAVAAVCVWRGGANPFGAASHLARRPLASKAGWEGCVTPPRFWMWLPGGNRLMMHVASQTACLDAMPPHCHVPSVPVNAAQPISVASSFPGLCCGVAE